MSKTAKIETAYCPSCDTRIRFTRHLRLGDIIVCQECMENLEVVRLSPLKLDWSLLDEEDNWDNVDEDDYDDQIERETPYDWD